MADAPGMRETEEAIVVIFNPALPAATRAAAQEHCDKIKQAPGALAFACNLFDGSSVPEVRFWCLQTVEEMLNHSYEVLEDAERAGLQNWLVALACQPTSSIRGQTFLQNKLAQVYALLIRHEYPEQWQVPFTSLLCNLQMGEDVINMFLRVMRAVDAEIINPECHRRGADAAVAMRIKDALREQCIADVASSWYVIMHEFHVSNPALVKECLQSMAPYISWVDVQLVVNEQFVTAFYSLLAKDGFVQEVSACLTEVVLKKMDPGPKAELISTVFHKPTIEACLTNRSRDRREAGEEGATAIAGLATLTSAACRELLTCSDKLSRQAAPGGGPGEGAAEAARLLQEMMPLALGCASHEAHDVSQVCVCEVQGAGCKV